MTINNQILDQIFLAAVGVTVGLISALGATLGIDLTQSTSETLKAVQIMSSDVDLLKDTYLLTVVIAGSLAGGALSYLAYPLPTPKAMAFKFLSSGIAGIVFSPLVATLICNYLDLPMTGMFALFVSAVVALTSWSVIQVVEPFAAKAATWWLGSKFKTPPSTDP